VRESNKKYPAHNLKHAYLLGVLLHCSCGRKWRSRVNSYSRRSWHGDVVVRKSLSWVYYCSEPHEERVNRDCPRTIGARKADEIVWDKVCEHLKNPDVLIGAMRLHISELLQQAESALEDKERFRRELDALILERQKVITWARKGAITDDDMEYQLGALKLQELNLKRELVTYGELVELTALNNWEEAARDYFLDLKAGLESLNIAPETEEEKQEIYHFKRSIIKNACQSDND
jgi:hypothetical protein